MIAASTLAKGYRRPVSRSHFHQGVCLLLPILLRKSVLAKNPTFSRPLVRSTEIYVGDHTSSPPFN